MSADYTSGAAWMNAKVIPISDAKISVFDWGLTRSDITYDVVHVWDGAFFRLDDYLDRFMASMGKLRMDVGMERAEIRAALIDMVATSGLTSAYVSMVASRGTPIVAGTRDPRACNNHFYAWAVPFVWVIPQDVAKRGAHISLAEDARRIPINSVDPTVKNYHWGDMTAALFQALDAGYDTTVLLDHDGCVTEGPGFNIFAVVDGTVVTPKSGMLEGITRKTVMEICAELGIPCEARDIPKDVFLSADEVFTATTAGGPVAVTRVNERILGNDATGAITERIIKTYWDWHTRTDLNLKVTYK
ncbi:aminotransferase class IV [Amylibacter sp. IMCC11727]|uniref:aminotransferase class IV n=1 Tax=Amylibacter sp. IMCC11727 TaxID=3039851 RepID=UPI00244DBFF9|nr:aminotransferase class IV [Amylibacter sp. IMCC11727]WGI20335.1 aminotransferase class IV [Amylibacter sp. IMCC11727]